MKSLLYILMAVVFIACLMGISSSDISAADYFGDFCWELRESATTIAIVKTGISHIGGMHLLITGKVMSIDGRLNSLIAGNAEIEGNKIYMSLGSAGNDTDAMWTSGSLVILDIATLNGTVESIGHDRNYSDLSTDIEYETYSLLFTPCP